MLVLFTQPEGGALACELAFSHLEAPAAAAVQRNCVADYTAMRARDVHWSPMRTGTS